MVDEIRSIKENLFKALAGMAASPVDGDADADDGDDSSPEEQGRRLSIDAQTARALLGAIFTRAGKGKDEVVQIVAREIGVAVAAMLKEPLTQLAKNQKLQISFEFVNKNPDAEKEDAPAEATKGKGKDKHKGKSKRRPSGRRRSAG